MSKIDWACLGIFILGFSLFLYAANTYNAIIGYIGIYTWIGVIIAYIVIYVYKELTKEPPAQKP